MVETGRDSMIDTPALNWPELQSVMYWYTGTVRDGETDDLFVDSLLGLFVDNGDAINTDASETVDMMIRFRYLGCHRS